MIPHDLKESFPEILEYVRAHDCTFEQVIEELKLKAQGQQKLNGWQND